VVCFDGNRLPNPQSAVCVCVCTHACGTCVYVYICKKKMGMHACVRLRLTNARSMHTSSPELNLRLIAN
jgi:hypothetical protein